MIADRIRITGSEVIVDQSELYLAKDADFTGTTDGAFICTSKRERIKIPNVIKGVPITKYTGMFKGSKTIREVHVDNPNNVSYNRMFEDIDVPFLNLDNLDMSYYDGRRLDGLFYKAKIGVLDLSNWNFTSTGFSETFRGATIGNLIVPWDTPPLTYHNATFMQFTSSNPLDISTWNITSGYKNSMVRMTNVPYMLVKTEYIKNFIETSQNANPNLDIRVKE